MTAEERSTDHRGLSDDERLTALEKKVDEFTNKIAGAVTFVKVMAAIVVAGASTWAWISAQLATLMAVK